MDFLLFGYIWLVISIYFFPTLISLIRNCKNKLGIFVLNLFLGYTFLGWVGALIWACIGENNFKKRHN